MDPLKIFATLETSLNEPALREYLCKRGWFVDATQNLSFETLALTMEHSGDGLYSIRGEMPRTSELDKLLEPLLSALSHDQLHINLDVFEEDGRLVKRVQT